MSSTENFYRYRCEPGATVIRALGGARATAKLLGVSAETCSRWNRPVERNGTGGYIPERFWNQLLWAKVPYELLTSKKKEDYMGALSRRKGADFERQVTNDLKAAGLDARKIPLSGADANHPGDVEVITPEKRWLLQCKISATGGGRQRVLKILTVVPYAYFFIDETSFCAMRQQYFMAAMKQMNLMPKLVPPVSIPGRLILKHIEGHDALVFRRSGQKEWCAIVRTELLPPTP